MADPKMLCASVTNVCAGARVRFLRIDVGWAIVVCFGLVFGCGSTLAQDVQDVEPMPKDVRRVPDAAAAGPVRESSSRPVGEGSIEILPNIIFALQDGEYIPWIGLTQNELHKMYDTYHRIARPDPPQYGIDRLRITGQVLKDAAALTVEIELKINTDQWTRIPLRFSRAILNAAIDYVGPGEFRQHVDADSGELTVWIRSPQTAAHRLRLDLIRTLEVRGDLQRLSLYVPRAAVASCKMVTPGTGLEILASDTAGALEVQEEAGKTLWGLRGCRDSFYVEWRASAGDSRPAQKPALACETAIRAEAEGTGSVYMEARMNVTCLEGRTDTIDLLLPPHAQFLSGHVPSLEGAELKPQEAAGDAERVRVQVKLPRKVAGPVTFVVRARTRRDPDHVPEPGQGIEVAGFEVVEALRQSGTILVSSRDDWEVRWAESDSVVRRPGGWTEEDGMPSGRSVRFDFFRQPSSLFVEAKERTTQLRVEPHYAVEFERHHVSLHARLKFNVRGALPSEVRLRVGEWSVRKVEPSAYLDKSLAWDVRDGELFIPLANSVGNEFEVEVTARQPIPSDTRQFIWSVPRPLVGNVADATLDLSARENVQVMPLVDGEAALIAEPGPDRELADPFPRFRHLWRYRVAGNDAPIAFACAVDVLDRVVTADLMSDVTLSGGEAVVRQEFAYRVQYDATSRVGWQVPDALLDLESAITVDGQSLRPSTLTMFEEIEDLVSSVGNVSIPLPSQKIGRFRISVTYRLPLDLVNGEFRVPLIVPVTDLPCRHKVNVHAQGIWQVDAERDPRWQLQESEPGLADGASSGAVAVATDDAPPALRLGLSRVGLRTDERVTVDLFWLQSWISGNSRQERAVFRFTSRRPRISVRLPQGVTEVQALLDGESIDVLQPSDAEPADPGSFEVDLPDELRDTTHVLEFAYMLPVSDGQVRYGVPVPEIEDVFRTGRSYWSLVMPSDTYLASGTRGLSAEELWSRDGLVWKRSATMQQSQIEQRMEASVQAAPEVGSNEYLFSCVGPLHPFSVLTVSRLHLAIFVAGVTLAVGLGLVYSPALRHPATLVIALSVLLPGLVVSPERTFFLAQFAGPGVLFAVIAWVLRSVLRANWSIAPRYRARPETTQISDGSSKFSSSDSPTAAKPQIPAATAGGSTNA